MKLSVCSLSITISRGSTCFQQMGIPTEANSAPLLAHIFLYSYEAEFTQQLIKDKKVQGVAPLLSHFAN